jgi:dihydrolipoamide dehydrogenase
MDKKTVAIIGAGVAGYTLAAKISKKFNVLLFENNLLGGTCVNKGCIPLKYFVHKQKILKEIDANKITLNVSLNGINMKALQDDKNQKTGLIRKGIASIIERNKINLIKGFAFLKDNTVECNEKKYSADIVVIAAGSKPVAALPFEIEDKGIVSLSSDSFLEIDYVPKNLAIIGGGYIGLEFASVFNSFGSKVCVFEMQEKLLGGLEASSVRNLEARLKKSGITFFKNSRVNKIASGGVIEYSSGDKNISSPKFDHVFISVGREASAGFNKNNELVFEKGYVKTSESFKTSLPGVYAIGDIAGPPFFAHRSAYQASLLAEHLLHGTEIKENALIPEVVFTSPELAKIGEDEESLKQKGIEFKSFKLPYSAIGKSIITGASGQLKLLSDKTGVILGCVIIGDFASELIGYIAFAIYSKMKISDFSNIVLPHPTLSELFFEARHLL